MQIRRQRIKKYLWWYDNWRNNGESIKQGYRCNYRAFCPNALDLTTVKTPGDYNKGQLAEAMDKTNNNRRRGKNITLNYAMVSDVLLFAYL